VTKRPTWEIKRPSVSHRRIHNQCAGTMEAQGVPPRVAHITSMTLRAGRIKLKRHLDIVLHVSTYLCSPTLGRKLLPRTAGKTASLVENTLNQPAFDNDCTSD